MKFYNISLLKRLLFAAISGAMVYPISFLKDINPVLYFDVSLSEVFIGTIFAILVMIPFQKKRNWFKSLLLILASIAIYTSMVYLTVEKYAMFSLNISIDLAITLSGGIGALLTGITVQLIAPLRLKSTVYPVLIILGLIAGYLFSMTIDSQSSLINAVGFIIWQVLVCLSIAISKK